VYEPHFVVLLSVGSLTFVAFLDRRPGMKDHLSKVGSRLPPRFVEDMSGPQVQPFTRWQLQLLASLDELMTFLVTSF